MLLCECSGVSLGCQKEMPRPDYKTCRQCGRHSAECGPLSHIRLCGDCAKINLAENVAGIAAGEGIAARRRVAGIERYAERVRRRWAQEAV